MATMGERNGNFVAKVIFFSGKEFTFVGLVSGEHRFMYIG